MGNRTDKPRKASRSKKTAKRLAIKHARLALEKSKLRKKAHK